ncbi:MAG: hypothetical protein J5547_03470, partial [Clostridia bacterium]|nr:hypothetical protein [Clostridia bacterium]
MQKTLGGSFLPPSFVFTRILLSFPFLKSASTKNSTAVRLYADARFSSKIASFYALSGALNIS